MDKIAALFPLLLALSVLPSASLLAQTFVPPRITQAVDEADTLTLPHSTHPLARPEFDRGAAPSALPMLRMHLVLKRSAQQQAALTKLLADQQDKTSPDYHHWLTPDEFGQRFGPAIQDLQTITGWLGSHGFQVAEPSRGRTVIEFSGTAAQVQEAFHTPIHKFVVSGEEHWANASEVKIPAALASVVAGVATLHNFTARPQIATSGIRIPAVYQPGSARPLVMLSDGTNALGPADYAVIYNIDPLYQSAINGAGMTIAVVGRTNINLQDIVSFRSVFNLPNNPPQVIVNGSDPGDLGGGEEYEAVLDISWSGAVAPGATVKLVVSASTNSSDGVDLSEQYIVDNNLADVMTESFGDCEANYTQAQAAQISSLAEQAAAEGISYFVSAGDAGSAGCDNFDTETSATGPVSVNILASTPYTTAVGGTQFNENGNNSAYWSSGNGAGYVSALSYIPEDVWNQNCYGISYGTCGSSSILAGGGGVSVLFPKPSWQTGVPGIPQDGARDVPDVALTASGHDFYLMCIDGSCTPNSQGAIQFAGVYGTSAAAPSFAGIMALVDQKTGSRQGLANVVLYGLAASENASACNASNTSGLPAGTCIFNDVTIGTNAVPGEANYNTPSETYIAGSGYDLASGLGSVNATNLVNQWTTFNQGPIPATMEAPTSGSVLSSTPTFTWNPATPASELGQYALWIGSTLGAYDLFDQYPPPSQTSATAASLPNNGSTVYVRLWSSLNGTWHYNDYTYTTCTEGTGGCTAGDQKATMQSPNPGSVLSSTPTFTWNPATPASDITQYALWIGSTPGAYDILDQYLPPSQTSGTAASLPNNGSTVYVRLWSYLLGAWYYNDYTYTSCTAGAGGCSAGDQKATMQSPSPNSLLSSTPTFTWNPATSASDLSEYAVWIGSTPGAYDLFDQYLPPTQTSATAASLPNNGSTVYVRLWSNLQGTWYYNDYTYKTCTAGSGGCAAGDQKATMQSPNSGSVLSSTPTFTWNPATPASDVSEYAVWIGSTLGAYDLFDQYPPPSQTSATAASLPNNGSIVYVRLWSNLKGTWYSNDYTYTTCTAGTGGCTAGDQKATMQSPNSGSILSSSPTFTWNPASPASDVSEYAVWIGSAPGTYDLLDQYLPPSQTSITASGLPNNGSTVYVRLWSYLLGAWYYIDYTYFLSSQ